jgi:beta-phosphoglucomutase-like phosphatase (HAD superfamily)
MKKVFIFDMDGVIIDNESLWEIEKVKIYHTFLGKDIYEKMGTTVGLNVDGVYDKAVALGAQVDKNALMDAFVTASHYVYQTAPLTEGLTELSTKLLQSGYRLAIVSASPIAWIHEVTKRLPFEKDISLIISLHEHQELARKPSPDGYNKAMKDLGVLPEETIILEDSNVGIASAKASGAFTIGLRQNLVEGYNQVGADVYAETLADVLTLISA